MAVRATDTRVDATHPDPVRRERYARINPAHHSAESRIKHRSVVNRQRRGSVKPVPSGVAGSAPAWPTKRRVPLACRQPRQLRGADTARRDRSVSIYKGNGQLRLQKGEGMKVSRERTNAVMNKAMNRVVKDVHALSQRKENAVSAFRAAANNLAQINNELQDEVAYIKQLAAFAAEKEAEAERMIADNDAVRGKIIDLIGEE